MGQTLEDKKRQIDTFFLMVYNKLYLKCSSKDEFERNLFITSPLELDKMLEKDIEAKEYFEKQKKEFTERFVLENAIRVKNSKEEKIKEEIQNDRNKIDEILKKNYDEAKKKENINDFQNVFHNNSEIKKLIETRLENKIYYNHCINLYSSKYLNEWDTIFKNIDDFFKRKYQSIFDKSINKFNLNQLLDDEGKDFIKINYFKKKKEEKLNLYDNEIENIKNKIAAFLANKYDEGCKKNSLYEFYQFFEQKKSEIKKYLIKYEVKNYYIVEYVKYRTKFRESLKKKEEIEELKQRESIDKYFKEECLKIYNVKDKSDLEKILNSSPYNGISYFNNIKKEKLNNYQDELEQIKIIISGFIANKYNQALASSQTEPQFKNYFCNNNDEIGIYIKKNEDLIKYYNDIINNKTNDFNKIIKERNDKKEIDNIFNEQYKGIFDSCVNKGDLKRKLEDKGSRFRGNDYFDNKMQEKLNQYDNEMEIIKVRIVNHFSKYYDTALGLNTDGDFDNFFNNKKNEIQIYLIKDVIPSLYNSELNKIKKKFKENKIDKYFKEQCPQIYNVQNKIRLETILNNSGFNGIEYFNKKKVEKLNNYENDLQPIKSKITDFINNKYDSALASSQSETEFKNYFNNNNSEIRIYISNNIDLINFYNNTINSKAITFNRILQEKNNKREIDNIFSVQQYQNIFNSCRDKEDLRRKLEEVGSRFRGNDYFENKKQEKLYQYDNEIENIKSRIKNHFSNYSDAALEMNSENDLINFFNIKKNEIQVFLVKNVILNLYNNELDKIKIKFNEKRIDKYFKEKCPQIYNVQNKTELETILNNSGFNGIEYFNKKKEEKLNNYENDLQPIKSKITDFINNKYNLAFDSSNNEDEFKSYFNDNNSEIINYIRKNDDLKAFYNNKLRTETEKFKKFIGDKNSIKEIDNFFSIEYKNIFDESRNEEDLKNKIDEKGSQFRGINYFEAKKQEKLDQFDNEIELLKARITKHFEHFYEMLEQNIENDFTSFFNGKKSEIQRYLTKDVINNLYTDEFNKYKKKFSDYKENLNKKKQEEEIDKYFLEKYPKIFEIKNKNDLENILNNNEFNEIDYFNKKKQEKLDNYEHDLLPYQKIITDFINNKYKKAFESSKSEEEFINYYENNNEEIKNYLYNDDLKAEFNNKLDNKTNDFKRDFEAEQKRQREEIEKKIKEEKLQEYNNEVEKIKNEYFNNLEIEEYQDQECLNTFKNYLKVEIIENDEIEQTQKTKTKLDVIKDIIVKLTEIESFTDKVRGEIILYLKELLDDKTKRVNHLNILLLGKTGAGKSTLINAILELEKTDNELPTGNIKPVTMETKYISSNTIDFLRCGDSRGIELGEFGIESVQEEAEKFIDEQLKTNDPDSYVHCIWYCTIPITDRFQNDECKLLENLGKKYSMKELPIIIVGTKANSKTSCANLKKNIESNVYKFNYPFIPVIAKKFDEKEQMGLEELKEVSILKAKDAVESACYQGVFKKLMVTTDEKIKKLRLSLKEKIQEKVKIITEEIEREKKVDVLKTCLKEMFTFILDSYLFIKLSSTVVENAVNKNIYSFEGEKMITDLINDFFKYCEDLYKKSYNNILKEKISFLSESIVNYQTNFNITNNNVVEMRTKDFICSEVKPKIEKILKNKADVYYLKNTLKIFLEIINIYIPFQFIGFYKKNLLKLEREDKDVREMITQNIRLQFEELEEKIKKYNEKIIEKKLKKLEAKKNMKENGNGMELDDEMKQFLEEYGV